MTHWRPLLQGQPSTTAMDVVHTIAGSITSAMEMGDSGPTAFLQALNRTGLAGPAGTSLLFAYLERTSPGRGAAETALDLLDRAIGDVAERPMDIGLYGGFSGVAWSVAHVQRLLPNVISASDPLIDIDQALLTCVSRPQWTGEYDLINGLVGIGVYAMERLPARSGRELLGHVIDRLHELALPRPEGLTWYTPPHRLSDWQRQLCPNGYYNLGVAHGVPGVIAFLAMAQQTNVRPTPVQSMLKGAISWLLAQGKSDEGSAFSPWTGPDVEWRPTKSAWCYGDPGVAMALLWAGRAAGETSWEQEALKLLGRSTNRPHEQAGIIEPGLCHGAVGLAHMYNRAYQATGDHRFSRAAHHWYERALTMWSSYSDVDSTPTGPANLFPHSGTRDDYSFLTGAAGLALALLAATTTVEPLWDRLLLAAISPMQKEGQPDGGEPCLEQVGP